MRLPYQTYVDLHDNGPLGGEGLRGLEEHLRPVYEPDGEANIETHKLYQYAEVAFALATVEKRDTDLPYTESFRELVENAKRAIVLHEKVHIPRYPGGAVLGFGGDLSPDDQAAAELEHEEWWARLELEHLIDLQLFELKMLDGEYEEALALFASGANSSNCSEWDGDEPDPRTQWVINCFEKLKAEPTKVKNWREIKKNCDEILSSWGYEVDDDPHSRVIEATEGRLYMFRDYWTSAAAFAESRLSQNELRELREAEEREHAERHMRLFFGEGCWEGMPENAKDVLKQADTLWWSKASISKSDIVIDLWIAVGQIINEYMWGRFVKHLRSQPAKELATKEVFDLDARQSWVPDLYKFIQLMLKHPRFKDFLGSMNVGLDQWEFLLEKSTILELERLNALRNNHLKKHRILEQHEISWAYRTFIGVDCEGVLPRLARLKR